MVTLSYAMQICVKIGKPLGMEDEIEERRKTRNLSFSKMIKMCNRLKTGKMLLRPLAERLLLEATDLNSNLKIVKFFSSEARKRPSCHHAILVIQESGF